MDAEVSAANGVASTGRQWQDSDFDDDYLVLPLEVHVTLRDPIVRAMILVLEQDADPRMRAKAAGCLAYWAPGGYRGDENFLRVLPDGLDVVPAMIKATRDPDERVRRQAVYGLAYYPQLDEVVIALYEAMADEVQSVAEEAFDSLAGDGHYERVLQTLHLVPERALLPLLRILDELPPRDDAAVRHAKAPAAELRAVIRSALS